MADPTPAIPTYKDLPYLIGRTPDATYIYFPSGAIRKAVGNAETGVLIDEYQVRHGSIDAVEAAHCAQVSQTLFGW